MTRFWNLLAGCLPTAGGDDPRDLLHTADRMRTILERERMRCDRANSCFALLTLTLSPRSDQSEITTLGRILRRRIRATDDAGLLEPRCIGVVLPETPAEGARKLAEDIRGLVPLEVRGLKCDIYVYPSLHEPIEEAACGAGANPGNTNGSSREIGAAASRLVPSRASRRANTMQSFFVQPLPIWKRALDVFGALVALVLLGPLMLLVAVAIKLTSPGRIIFKQQRHAIGGRPFTIYKFRTMIIDAECRKAELRPFSEQDGPAFKLAKDPRVTPIGRFLRVTSIDELPQLWNVLKGDMSLVGPRPLPCDESAACSPWQKRRLNVTPGLTCIWQVKGRSDVAFDEWMRMDLEYIQRRSIAQDLKILVQTMPAVLFGDGAC